MLLHLRKQLTPRLPAASHPSAAALSCSLHLRALLSTTSTSATPFSIADYLVAACGLTRAKALKAAKQIPHLRSASNPDAVLALLSGAGLSRRDIAAVVANDPPLLRARVGNIGPRLDSLRERVGLSCPEIARFLLTSGARDLRSCDVAPKLEFWIPFFGSFDKLLQIMRNNNCFLTTDLEKVAKPNIELLQQCGLSVCDIVKMLATSSRMLVYNPERVQAFVKRVDKLGVPRNSYAFKYAVGLAGRVNEDKVAFRMAFLSSTLGCSMEKIRDAVCIQPTILGISVEKLLCKIEFLRTTLGCSNDKFSVAVCKRPQILGLSEDILCRKIDFMVSEVGLEREYIVDRPVLLSYSLEKRLAPRHYVIKILQSKGLLKNGVGFRQLVDASEKRFATRMRNHMAVVPGLADAYAAACAGKILSLRLIAKSCTLC